MGWGVVKASAAMVSSAGTSVAAASAAGAAVAAGAGAVVLPAGAVHALMIMDITTMIPSMDHNFDFMLLTPLLGSQLCLAHNFAWFTTLLGLQLCLVYDDGFDIPLRYGEGCHTQLRL